MPFSQNDVVLRRKRTETIMINLALAVLNTAGYRSSSGSIATADVRLALRVLHPYLGDQALLRAYWDLAAQPTRRPGEDCHGPLSLIIRELVKRGYAVEAEVR